MIKLAVIYAFEIAKADAVLLNVYTENPAAKKCYEKVGFKKEGLIRDARKHGDEYWNQIEMGILESEWKAKS